MRMRRRKNARASAAVWRKVVVRFACHGGPVRKDLKCCWVTFLTRCVPQFKQFKNLENTGLRFPERGY
jgi:hypothetical protein